MKEKILFAGFGGQGILAAGRIFADVCIGNGYNASWLPSYGPEMRGGTCNCQVVVSDGQILSPIFTRPTCMVIMNQASFDRFSESMQNTKLVILNSSLVEIPKGFETAHPDIEFYKVDATNIALKLGSVRSANMVMLGAFAKYSTVLSIEGLKTSIQKSFAKRPAVMQLNLKSVAQGNILAIK